MFTLVDTWTDEISELEYHTFLYNLLIRITYEVSVEGNAKSKKTGRKFRSNSDFLLEGDSGYEGKEC